MSNIVDKLRSLAEGIASLPSLIVNGIKDIFVPDPEVIKGQIDDLTSQVESSLGISKETFDDLKNVNAESIEDIDGEYSFYGIGTLNLKFFDTSVLKQAVENFRPIIRGFVVLLLMFFVLKQIMSFIGQDSQIDNSNKGGASE